MRAGLPEGLDLGDLLAALSSDLVDVLGGGSHHLLHPFLLQLLLVGLTQTERTEPALNSVLSSGDSNRRVYLFLSLPEEEPEPLVLLDPGGQLPLTLLPRPLQLRLQLPQNPELLIQPGLPRAGHLQVQLQVQGGAKQTVQTFD